MALARALYERFRQLIHEAAKFGVIGVIGLVITNGGFALLHNDLHIGPITSTTAATFVATVVAYLGNRYWSFRDRERTGVMRESVIFFVLNGVGLLIQDAAVGFNAYVLDLQHHKIAEFVALNLGIAVATLFRFWSYRKWVWAAPAGETGSGAGQPVMGGPGGPAGTGQAAPSHAWAGGGQPARRHAVTGRQAANGHRPPELLSGVNGRAAANGAARRRKSPLDG